MRLSFIYEAFNLAKNQKQLLSVSQHLGIEPDQLIADLDAIDLTGKYHPWILRQIYFKNIRTPEDNRRVAATLANFKKVGNKLAVKDINQYQKIHDLETAIEPLLGTGSKRSGAFQVDPQSLNGVELINQIGSLRLWEITDPDSLGIMGEGTKWCTRLSYSDNMTQEELQAHGFTTSPAEDYISNYKRIYIISDKDTPIIQFTSDFDQTMDRDDNNIVLASYRELLAPLERKLKDRSVINYANNVIGGRWPEIEPIVIADPNLAFIYARDVIKGPWPAAESTIAKDPELAYGYAAYSIKKRWPAGELAILSGVPSSFPSKDMVSAIKRYGQRFFDGGRWLEAEPMIAKNPVAAYNYAINVVGSRWPEGEPAIASNAQTAWLYAMKIIRGRWPEAEPTIAQDPTSAVNYAYEIIRGRWPEAEPTIAQDTRAAYDYAYRIIRDDWPIGEPAMAKDPQTWKNYTKPVFQWRKRQ